MLVHASALRAVLVQSSPVKKLRVSILVFTRAASSTSSAASGQLQHSPHVRDIRNIGIIAHVDAGKTTTTERMLYCSGASHRQGKVDEGSTVTDFLPLERKKGITIQSAAVTFHWPQPGRCSQGTHPKTINLLDTPGHQDFRFEVDRCIPVLDGAVCIIDGVQGVEAHTERVWASAQEFKVPRIAFVNKLDREGSSFRKSVVDIGLRLNAAPIVCQIPWYYKEDFVGVVDVLDRVGYRWAADRKLTQIRIDAGHGALCEELDKARENFITVLADHDEEIADRFLEDANAISDDLLKAGLRRAVGRGDGAVVPVFAGAALKSIGVEPLLDAIIDYLPSPDERPELEVRNNLSRDKLSQVLKMSVDKFGHQKLSSIASVFKVMNHPKEGLLSFVRVYDGILPKNAATWNTHTLLAERPMGMVQIMANKTHTIDTLGTGQIGALRGLKHARTGDTLITMVGNKVVPPAAVQCIQIRPPEIPPPLAFLAIDALTPPAATELETALTNASREDPSLRWTRDEKMDQFVVQGMGTLHLEVVIQNLKDRCKLDAMYGEIQVDYKEHVDRPTDWHTATYDKIVASKTGSATCSAMIEPLEVHHRSTLLESTTERHGNLVHVRIPRTEDQTSFNLIEARQALENGAYSALARGPRRGSPVHGCHVTIEVTSGALRTPSSGHFLHAARRAVADALEAAHEKRQVSVLEPIMAVVITCPESAAGTVQHDITAAAGGQVEEVKDLSVEQPQTDGSYVDATRIYAPPDPYESVTSQRARPTTRRVQIRAKVPFKEMLTYDAKLRSKTEGRHTLEMEFGSLAKVTGLREKNL